GTAALRKTMLSTLEPSSPPAQVSPAPAPVDHSRRIEELGRIILAYSEVTEKLQQSQEQLHRTVQSLQQELGEKNRQLERRNRLAALGEMAAGLAHEIRNPLGGIQLYASLLAGDVKDRPESLAIVQKIAAGVKRLEALVGQVLQFSREIRTNPAPDDLAGVVAQAVEYAGQAFERHNVRCVVDGPTALPATVDGLLLGQSVLNLLINAAEAAGDGGVVTVAFRPPATKREAKQFVLTVADTGPGVPADLLDKVFNPFFTTKDEGTGLGLSIVHRVIEAHDGTITVTNQDGGGAKFEIRI
ncbi:MAG TPA: ATP-binding protein, partial [Humisphaera sp.]